MQLHQKGETILLFLRRYGVLRTTLDKTSAAFRQRLDANTGQFQAGTGAVIVRSVPAGAHAFWPRVLCVIVGFLQFKKKGVHVTFKLWCELLRWS
jgi:hypothetical protein